MNAAEAGRAMNLPPHGDFPDQKLNEIGWASRVAIQLQFLLPDRAPETGGRCSKHCRRRRGG